MFNILKTESGEAEITGNNPIDLGGTSFLLEVEGGELYWDHLSLQSTPSSADSVSMVDAHL